MEHFNYIDILEALELCGDSNSEKNILIKSLLHSPWKCSDELIKKYIEPKLATIILKFKKSVNLYIYKKHSIYNTTIDELKIFTVFESPNSLLAQYDENLTQTEINLYIEIIEEDLLKENRKIWSDLASCEKDALLGLYMCSAIGVYNIAGIIKNTPNTHTFQIVHQWHTAFKIKGLRDIWNDQSDKSDRMQALEVLALKHYKNKGKKLSKNNSMLIMLARSFIDKFFSIHFEYIQSPQKREEMQCLIDRMQLLIFLWLYALEKAIEEHESDPQAAPIKTIHHTVSININEIIKAGFNTDEINSLLKSALNSPLEHILNATEDNDIYKIRYLDIKYAAQKHAKELQAQILNDNWFEEGYVIPYLKRNYKNSDRFVIGDSIKAKEKHNLPPYDVDAIIYDKKTNIFYFCQIKHRLYSRCIGLRGELQEYVAKNTVKENDENLIPKGIKQLHFLRSILNSHETSEQTIENVKAQITTAFQNTKLPSKLIKNNDFSNNSRFLLIHNIENFDFCTKNGITMFEWNTFRNLLKGSVTQISKQHISRKEYKTKISDFSDLISIKKILLEEYLETVKQNDQQRSNNQAFTIPVTDTLNSYHYIYNFYSLLFANKKIPFLKKKEFIKIPVI